MFNVGRRVRRVLAFVVAIGYGSSSALAQTLPTLHRTTSARTFPASAGRAKAVPSRRSLAAQTGTTLLAEPFSSNATVNSWVGFGGACLTAGNSATPAASLPACSTRAAQDAIGQGALQLTQGRGSLAGMIVSKTPLPTANGLQVTFDDYAFDGTATGANGMAFFFTNAAQPLPTASGSAGSELGYAPNGKNTGVANAYVAVGLDEYGGFSAISGGPGTIPETITVRGAASAGFPYLGGALNAAGKPASLPFHWDSPASTTRPSGVPTVRAQLTAAGLLTVAVDRHDGNGFVVYDSQSIVGVNGEPAVPAQVYFGMSAATGGNYNTHQVTGLVVSALAANTTAATLLNETFANGTSTPSLWSGFGDACLTAGTAPVPATSLPACGKTAPLDAPGSGTLQLTRMMQSRYGAAIERTPLPTANGLSITFTDYAFDGVLPGGNGVAFFFTDASQPLPTTLGQRGGALVYRPSGSGPGLPNAYLGVGLDEYGAFSAPGTGYIGGPGTIPESISVRGAAATGYQYIGGAVNGSGAPASLPFTLDAPSAPTRPATAPTIQATLSAAGALTVAIDHHDGNGFVTYYSGTIVGAGGQPAVPANVYFGVGSSSGGTYEVHQIGGLVITSLGGTPPVTTAGDNNPPQIVSSNGSLTLDLTAQADPLSGNPEFSYNGSSVPPTLRLLPGDTLVVNLTNNLPVPPTGAGYTDNINLHYHGLHVSPQAPGDDEIDMLAGPGQSLHYAISIPANHPPGLYWYHTHAHAETERDTLAGMSGALIIDGIAAYTPQVASLTERVIVARDAPLAGTALPDADVTQIYAMKWAMQHGVAMHASHAGSAAGGAGSRTEYHAASTMQTRNPYVKVNPTYRRPARAAAADSHCIAGSPEAPVRALTINGSAQPALRIAPGEQQFWRVVNAGADTYLDFTVDNTQLQIISLDGVPLSSGVGTPASMTVPDWVLPPGSRAEFLITGPPAGTTAFVRTNCFDAGPSGQPMPAEILASINPAAASANVKRNAAVARISPKAVRYRFHTAGTIRVARPLRTAAAGHTASAIRAATVTATRTLYYGDQYTINGLTYDPAAPPQFYAQTGTVEQWTIVNTDTEVHTFHIHQVHFVVQAINGTTQSQQYLLDNVNVPPATAAGPGTVTLLLDFTDPTIIGTFLLHCHILSHEDAGMMAKIRIGISPPLSLSSTNVTFSGPTAGAQSVSVAGGAAPYSVTGCSGVARAAISGSTISIFPAASGACVLTVADASVPSITTTVLVNVTAPPPTVSILPATTAFASPTSAAQTVTISGGTPPYIAAGCTSVASDTIAGSQLTVTPQAPGTCSLAITDANGDEATLPVSVNAATTGNPLDNLTFHQNPMRTGWYQYETTLTTANVNPASFGLQTTLTAPAGMPGLSKVYGQPLYVTQEPAVDGNVHNLLIVSGSAAQIYAFDETTQTVVWHRDFTNTAAGIYAQPAGSCSNVEPYQALIGTPVIDRALDRLFVVVATYENGVYYTRIHAIALGSGVDVVPPTVLAGTVALATGGTASVSSFHNMNRAALLEANGNIYVGLGTHCDGSTAITHGWLLAFNATTLAPTANLIDSTNGNVDNGYFLGGIWMGGYGPAADAQGNIYFATGNGAFDGVSAFAMSVLKVPGNLDMTQATFFSPIQEAIDSNSDADLGSGGVMLLPDQPGAYPHIAVAGGKCSINQGCFKYLLNRDNLGGQQPANAGTLWNGQTGGGMWGGPAYFVDSNGTQHVLYGGSPTFNTYNLSTSPVGLTLTASAQTGCLNCEDEGSQPVVSSNGVMPGTAIAWVVKGPTNAGGPMYLYAFDAVNEGAPLYTGLAGSWVPSTGHTIIGATLVSPLIVNGRVYLPTEGGVAVFGLTSTAAARVKH